MGTVKDSPEFTSARTILRENKAWALRVIMESPLYITMSVLERSLLVNFIASTYAAGRAD